MRTPFGSVRRGAALACCLSAGVLLSLAAGASWAGLAGSKHDFSGLSGGTLTPTGDCSACHIPHKSDPNGSIWSRNLSAERTYFSQQANPNYLPGSTLLCYDCHDDNATTISPAVDADPLKSIWNLSQEPQNIAFTDDTLAQGGTKTGYYELANGDVPGGPTPLPAAGAPTGGHYFKAKLGQAPNGGYEIGDKLDCAICHDPHAASTGTNEVMLRTAITVGGTITIGDDLRASSKTRNYTTGVGNRQMCAGCHQYSDTVGAEKVLYNVRIIKPPAMAYVGHSSGDTAAECTACHAHNALDCGTCHGSPPPGAAASYAGITEAGGPHPRHARTVAGGGYGFSCAVCHSQFPTGHQNAAYQNVSFLAGKNPAGAYVAGSRTCNNLYCHSRGAHINGSVNALGTAPQWTSTPDWSANDLGCEACHGSNPARASGLMNYGAPGYANQALLEGVAKANSHAKHATYPCARCHYNVIQDTVPADGWTLYNVTLHANNTNTSFTFDVNPDTTATGAKFADSYSYNAAGGTCSAIDCHNGNNAQWGATLACTDCHMRTSVAGGDRDDWDPPNGTAALLDSDQYLATGHGRTSGVFPWPDNNDNTTPPNLGCLTTDGSGDTPVGGCHAAKVPHGLAMNPFRLATPNNTTFAFENPSGTIDGDSVNLFCQTCHVATLEKTHSKAITGDWGTVDWGDPAGAPTAFKCTDCHDPHGDSPDYMIHAKVFAASSTGYGVPVTTGLGIQPTGAQVIVFDVTAPAQADYVNTSAGSSTKICQVCHQANSYFTISTAVAHNAGTACMECHLHKEGFKPAACEGCHNGELATRTKYPLAPNVMGPGSNRDGTGTTPKPYDDGAWGYNVSGHGANGTAGVTFDTDKSDSVTNILDPDAACDDCHTLQSHHNNGTLNSASGGSPQANTYHLSTTGTWPFLQAGDTGSTIQTRFDDACYNRCHQSASPTVPNMRHAFVASPVSQFGNRGSLANGEDIHGRTTPAWPIDSDLTTSANITNPDYVPCVSCHEPHGTDVSEPGYPSNRMMRAIWNSENTLCYACHQ